MNSFDWFPYFWLAVIAVIGVFHAVWAVYELRRGEAKWPRSGVTYARADEPFYFWAVVLGRIGAVLVAAGMFLFGIEFIRL